MAEDFGIATNDGRCDAESLVNLGTSLDTREGFSVSQILTRVQLIRNGDSAVERIGPGLKTRKSQQQQQEILELRDVHCGPGGAQRQDADDELRGLQVTAK